MVSLFLSHSSQDRDVVDDIQRRLAREGFEAVFLDYDPDHGIPAGRQWEPELYSALQRCDAVLFVATRASVESRWCFAELALARSTGKPVFPVRVSADVTHPLIGDIQWADVTVEGEGAYKRLWTAMRDRGVAPADSFDWDPRRSPYPGLAAYHPEDAAVFFGRADVVNSLLVRMNAAFRPQGHPFLAIVGPSGCGKSSLVRAGLVPRVRRMKPDWLVLEPFTPGSAPVDALARTLSVALAGSARQRSAIARRLRKRPFDLSELIKDLAAGQPSPVRSVLMVVDQAEQLLGRGEMSWAADEANEFVRLLEQCPQQDPAVWVVCTLRSEFLGAAARDPGLVALVRDPVVVGPLERARLPVVIEGPAQRAGLRFDPGLVQRMVDETRGGDALPLLGYALLQLYDQRQPDGLITTGSYERLGGVEGALRQRADEALEVLQAAGHGADVFPALLRLVAVDEHDEPLGRTVPVDAFDSRQQDVISTFVEARLLVSGGDGSTAAVQVAHETLFRAWPPLREAIAASRESLRLRTALERLARDWERAGRRDSYLLQGDRLQQYEAWASIHHEGLQELAEFLACSQARDSAALQREAELLASRVLIKLDEDPERNILLALAGIAEYAASPGLIRALDAAVRASRLRALLTGHDDVVNSVAYAPDGSRLVTASDDGTARIWSRGERRELLALRGHSARVRCAGYSPDGTRILTASDDETIKVWDSATGRLLFSAAGFDRVYGAAWSPDGALIAAVSGLEGYLTLRNGADGALVTTRGYQPNGNHLPADSNDRYSVAFSPDGTHLVTGSAFGIPQLWRLGGPGDPTAVARLPNPSGQFTHCAVFSPDGMEVLAGNGDGVLRRLDVATGEPRPDINPGTGAVNSVSYCGDGTLILTAGYEKAAVWDAVTGASLFGLPGHRDHVLGAAFSPDQREIATACRDGGIRVWSAAVKDGYLPVRYADRLYAGCFSPDGSRVLVAAGRTANVFNARDGSPELSITGHTADITGVAFSPDGTMFATSSYDYTACVWSAADGTLVHSFIQHSSPVQNVAFSADATRIITCAGGKGIGDYIYGNVKVWDARTGDWLLGIEAGEGESVLSARFSPDGSQIVAALGLADVRIWDVATGQTVRSLTGHSKAVYYAEFSPDGSRIVSASGDGTARIWDVSDGAGSLVLSGHRDLVAWATFSPDGTRIVTASADGTAIVWDAANGRPLAEFGHGAALSGAEFSPDGSRVLTTGLDAIAGIWPCYRLEELIALARTRVFRALTDAERQEYGLRGVS
jgi:WD40 repeat protein